ncbi:MAG: CoA transferase [Phreatobacter sp.]|uniref:CaiB/BaiF CoA transferase family protein n=1 Tax=Phreatobacter sp. TaxID=1966341 RepID=UPI001A4E498F|nr:CoA transferase [Phreatobacter sp.]MBL8571276.1 CoA transferase [Phreatobacter sp.]
MKPLRNITVVDLSKVLAGPLCGQYLGDLGADVIKIEPVDGGDDTRGWLPQREKQSGLFLAVNHNKRSLAVDLKSDEGRAIVHALVAKADVVLQGFGGGTAQRLGVDYETVSKLNPNLIYCEISGYGRSGPLGDSPGYDVMLQAFSGMISTMGEPGGNVTRASFSPVDIGTGLHAVSGVLAALLERSQTGRGSYVEVTLLDTSLSLMGYLAQGYWLTGKIPQRMGSAHPSLAPYQAFSAADGELMIGVGNDAQWRRLCAVMDMEPRATDPAFATNEARVENFDATAALVEDKVKQRPVAAWLEALSAAGIPSAPIHTVDQALAHPQVAERGLIVETDHALLGPLPRIGYPVAFNGEPRGTRSAPPLLGEHSADILAGLGYGAEAIDDLATRGIVKLAASPARPVG